MHVTKLLGHCTCCLTGSFRLKIVHVQTESTVDFGVSRLLTRIIPPHILFGGLVINTRVRIVALQFTIIVGNVNITVKHFLLMIGIYVCVELLGYSDHLLFLWVDMFYTNFPLDDGSVLVYIFHLKI